MKLILATAASLAFVLAFSGQAFFAAEAAAQGGGFTGPGPSDDQGQGRYRPDPVTPGEAAELTVDRARLCDVSQVITVTGRISRRLGGDEYLFRDATGSIVCRIADDRWFGNEVTPETDVAIVGMMERKSCEEVYVAIGVFPRKK